MVRILLADDSAIELDCVKFLISRSGVQARVETAPDGRRALAALQRAPFDILMTDIKMPFLDGLQLAARAREIHPEIVILILSGYGEFEYAKSAIQSGAAEYLLKPAEEEALRQALLRAEKRVEQARRAQRGMLRTLISVSAPAESGLFQGEAQCLVRMAFQDAFLARRGEEFEFRIGDAVNAPYAFLPVSGREGMLLIGGAAEPDAAVRALRSLIAGMTDAECEIRARPVSCAAEVYSAWRALAAERAFPIDECVDAARRGNIERLEACYRKFRRETQDGGSLEEARSAVYEVLSRMDSDAERVRECADFDSLDAAVRDALSGLRRSVSGLRADRIKAYIAEHYSSDLSLQLIADSFYISPNYLCKLFKQETGITIQKYIADFRMKRACELLESTFMRVNLIAKETGFRSSSYFCQRFREAHGITPEAYRANALRAAAKRGKERG